jgi:hypothetical protein
MMPSFTIHWLAVLLGIVISMVVGGVMFARPVLGTYWMGLVDLRPDRIRKEDATRGIVIALACAILLNLGFNLVLGWTSAKGAGEGAMLGLLAWLAFALPTAVVHPTFEGRPGMLGVLYGGQHLLEYALIGLAQGWLSS